MITISQAVEDIFNRSPFLSEVLYEDMVNISGVARHLRPQIEKRLLEKVSEEAVAMALHRVKKKLKPPASYEEILKDTKNITMRSNLVEFMFLNSPDVSSVYQEISKITETKKDIFFNISVGLTEATIIVSSELEKDVEELLKNQKNVQKVKDLSSITIKISSKMTLTTPGVYYLILKTLAWNGINDVEVMTVGWELSMFISSEDADRAFSVIKSITS
jgi:aspartokinase